MCEQNTLLADEVIESVNEDMELIEESTEVLNETTEETVEE
jgi:hypothetical protein